MVKSLHTLALSLLTFPYALAFSGHSYHKARSPLTTVAQVSAIDTPDVASLERGMGGRIEEAFASAKERGEAAFVTFVTAGYPEKKGAFEQEHAP